MQEGGRNYLPRRLVELEKAHRLSGHSYGVTAVGPRHAPPQRLLAFEQ